MQDTAVLFYRLLSSEGARDIEVLRMLRHHPILAVVARRIQHLPESERLKILLGMLGAQCKHLEEIYFKLAAAQPVVYQFPAEPFAPK